MEATLPMLPLKLGPIHSLFYAMRASGLQGNRETFRGLGVP